MGLLILSNISNVLKASDIAVKNSWGLSSSLYISNCAETILAIFLIVGSDPSVSTYPC